MAMVMALVKFLAYNCMWYIFALFFLLSHIFVAPAPIFETAPEKSWNQKEFIVYYYADALAPIV